MVNSFDDNGSILPNKLNINIGDNWDELKIENKYLNSVFNKIDSGDRIVSETELEEINRILEEEALSEDLITTFSPDKKNFNLKSLLKTSPTKTLNKINYQNFFSLYRKYNDSTGSTLISDVLNSNLINKKEKTEFISQLKDIVAKYCKDTNIYDKDILEILNNEESSYNELGILLRNNYFDSILQKITRRYPQNVSIKTPEKDLNGEVDKSFFQSTTGDCWLLATIIALSKHSKGKEILNKSIIINDDGSATVTLRGVNKRYHIPSEELNGRTELAEGELDVRALEIAIDKYFYEQRGVNNRLDINGNGEWVALDILNGKGDFKSQNLNIPFYLNRDNLRILGLNSSKPTVLFSSVNGFLKSSNTNLKEHLQKLNLEEINNPENIHLASIGNKEDYTFKNNTDGKEVTLIANHSYAIEKADDKNVYIINPWDTGTTIAVPIEDFFRFFERIHTLKVL